MKYPLTIAYFTSRKDCKIEWFFDSLKRELNGREWPKVLVIDFWHSSRAPLQFPGPPNKLLHMAPKPTVWQGPSRATSQDWFAASNARNTALIYADDGWLAHADDLSVLMPGWLNAVSEAMDANEIVYGAYKKVLELKVENGNVTHHVENPAGVDSRWRSGRDNGPVKASGSWCFGCSLAMPVEALLKVNGWDEDCDGMGSDDSVLGILLGKAGFNFRYDRRMLTFESEEGHHTEPAFRRTDKGVSPKDKSHALIALAMSKKTRGTCYTGSGNLRELRAIAKRGDQLPPLRGPAKDWFDGQPISEMA